MPDIVLRVFVSSTWEDLAAERKALEAALQRLQATRFNGMEYFGSRDETTREASLAEVDRSQIYVGIIAGRYGSGITEDEYRRARTLDRRLPCFIYVKAEAAINARDDEPEKHAQLAALKEELRRDHLVSTFDSPDQLATMVAIDLANWIIGEYLAAQQPENLAFRALHQLPSPPRDFTGRAAEITEFMTALETGGATICGMRGLGGVGKTALALKLADQLRPRYPDAQFYLDLKGAGDNPVASTGAMEHIVRAYHPAARLPESEAELGAIYRSVLDGKRALLLLDNAASAEQIEPLIPPVNCVVLVTSRQHFAIGGIFTRNLGVLPPPDARHLLLRIAPRIGDQAGRLAELCGGLPLALELVARALAVKVNINPADYTTRLADAQQRLKLLDKVEAAIGLSYKLLVPKQRKLWRALAVFPASFDDQAAAAVWETTVESAQDALAGLLIYSLIEWSEATSRYRLHDLARLFAAARLANAEHGAGKRRHAIHYETVLRAANQTYLQGAEALTRGIGLFDSESSNILAGQAWAAQQSAEDDAAAALCSAYREAGGYLLDLLQHPHDQIRWREAALSAAQRLHLRGAEGTHLRSLGNAYYAQGESHYAAELYEQALLIFRETADRHGEGQTLSNLANACFALGDLPRAAELYARAIPLLRDVGDRRVESYALNSLGHTLAAMGQPDLAIERHEQALGLAREIGDRRSEGAVLGSLALTYAKRGALRDAIDYHEQHLSIAREIRDRSGESKALNNLGNVYVDLGELRRGLECYERALAIDRQIGDRRGEGKVTWNISLALNRLGDRRQAIAQAEAALEIYEQIKSPDAANVSAQLAEWRGRG